MTLNQKLVLPANPKLAMFPVDASGDSGLSNYLSENGGTTAGDGFAKNVRIVSILCTNTTAAALDLRVQMIDPATLAASGNAQTIGFTDIPLDSGETAGTKGIEVLKATEFSDILQADPNSNEFFDMPAGSDILFQNTGGGADGALNLFVRYYELDE